MLCYFQISTVCIFYYFDLRPNEAADLFTTTQRVANIVEKYFKASSLTIAIQVSSLHGLQKVWDFMIFKHYP